MAPKASELAQSAKIDLSRYQTGELADQVSQLVSVPRRLRTIVTCGAVSLLATWIIVLVAYGPRVHWGVLVGLFVYSSLAALAIGVLLGVLIVLNRALDNLVELFDVSLSITDQAVGDLDDYRDGDLQIDPGQLLHSVHDDVVLPTVEKVIYGQSRLLGKLLFPLYRSSIGKMTKRVLSFVYEDEPERSAPTAAQHDDNLEVADPREESPLDRSHRILRKAHDIVTRRGHQLRRTVIIPLGIVLGCAFILAILPMVIALIIVLVR